MSSRIHSSSKTRKSKQVYNFSSKTRKSNNLEEIVLDEILMDEMLMYVINDQIEEYDRKLRLLDISDKVKLYNYVNIRNENLFVLFCKKFMFMHANEVLNFVLNNNVSKTEIINMITQPTIYNETAYIYARFYIYLYNLNEVNNIEMALEASDIIRYMDDNTSRSYRHTILHLPENFEFYNIGDITEEIKQILKNFGDVNAYDILDISNKIPNREDRFLNDNDVKLDFNFSDDAEEKEDLGERLDRVVERKNRPSRFKSMFNRLFSRKVGVMGGRKVRRSRRVTKRKNKSK